MSKEATFRVDLRQELSEAFIRLIDEITLFPSLGPMKFKDFVEIKNLLEKTAKVTFTYYYITTLVPDDFDGEEFNRIGYKI